MKRNLQSCGEKRENIQHLSFDMFFVHFITTIATTKKLNLTQKKSFSII